VSAGFRRTANFVTKVSRTDRDDRSPGVIAVLAPEVGAVPERHDAGLVQCFGPLLPGIGRAYVDQHAAAGLQCSRKPGGQLPGPAGPSQTYGSRDAVPDEFAEVGAAKLRRASGASGERRAAFDGRGAAVHSEHGVAPGSKREREPARPCGKHEHGIARAEPQLALDDTDLLVGLIVTDRAVPEAAEEDREVLPVGVRNVAGGLALMIARQTGAIALGMMASTIETLAFPQRV
jgi:hypothetical protein